MARSMKKTTSSPMVLIIPLLIALGVILTAAIVTNINGDTRSKAEYNPTLQCISTCNSSSKIGSLVIKPADCVLDCPKVANGTMNCSQFCSENVRAMVNARERNSHGECVAQCAQWVANPCANDGAVCRFALGKNEPTAKSQCATACNKVKTNTSSCDLAMTQSAMPAVNLQVLGQVQQSCRNYFGTSDPPTPTAGPTPTTGPSSTPTPTVALSPQCVVVCSKFPPAVRQKCMEICQIRQ